MRNQICKSTKELLFYCFYELKTLVGYINSRYQNYSMSKKYGFSIALDASLTGGWKHIKIGSSTRINSGFNLRNRQGKIEIGRNCLIARNVTIILNEYNIKKIVISSQDMKSADVKIGDNVLIGTESIIMSGVEIGEGAVIGANSVVTKSVEAYSIVAGSPARNIASRKK